MQTVTSLSAYPLSGRPFTDSKSVEAEIPTKIEAKFARDIKQEFLKAQIIYEEDDVPPVPKCGICFESLMDRKVYVYDCQHTYCLDCSDNFSIKHDQTTIKGCPACRFPEKSMTAKTPFDNRCETIPELLKAYNVFASIHELEKQLPIQHPLIEGEWLSLENVVYNYFPQLASRQTDTQPIASASLEQPAARSSIAPKIVVICQEEDKAKLNSAPLLSAIKASKQQYLIYPLEKNGASNAGEKQVLLEFAKNNFITFIYLTDSLCKELNNTSTGRTDLIDQFIDEKTKGGQQMYKNIVPVRSSGVNHQNLPLILRIVISLDEGDSSAQERATKYIHETLGRPTDVKTDVNK